MHGKPLQDVHLGEDLDGMDVVARRLLLADEQLSDLPDGRNESLERVNPDEPLGILVSGMDGALGSQSWMWVLVVFRNHWVCF